MTTLPMDNWIIGPDHVPRQVPWDEYVEWLQDGDFSKRRVAETTVGDAWVSTVFLTVDHNFGWGGPPILFETMIFRGEYDQEQWRYSTWDQAVAGHERVVEALRNGRDPASR